MRTVIVYKAASDHARPVDEFLREFEHRTGKKVETMEPETPAGTSFCEAYGIVEYPTAVAIDDKGQMQQMWRGLPLPTISEVSYYVS